MFFLVYDNGKPVGLAKLNVDHARGPYSAADALELERIYFLKEAAGKGLGKATVAYISDLARQKGKAVVWLKAMADNPSVGFYQKQGFTIAEETYLDYALLKDEFRKMVVMFKTL